MNAKGFSLIELMIVVAIVGLLTAICYPSYTYYIARARRVDGKVALVEAANRLEQYYLHHHTYAGATIGTGKDSDIQHNDTSGEGWYHLSLKAHPQSYTVIATPIKAQADHDKACGKLCINQLGQRQHAGNAEHAKCWS